MGWLLVEAPSRRGHETSSPPGVGPAGVPYGLVPESFVQFEGIPSLSSQSELSASPSHTDQTRPVGDHSTNLSTTPFLIVLDERLPGVLGSTIASGLRALGWTTPLVLLGEGKRHRDAWTLVLPASASPDLVFRASRALAAGS